ncbi:MAG: hypothetical protein DSY55_04215 [Clostridia bacterium]|nr:MAG: hypothetical protein DSY55_04215 [Clostridia bacterium]
MSLSYLFGRQSGLQLAFFPMLDPDAVLETIVAFANTEGGDIVVGADTNGHVQSGMQAEDVEDIVRMAIMQVRPPVQLEAESYEMPRGTVLVFHVARSPELHSLPNGRVLARRGSENRVLTGQDLTLAAVGRATGAFELEEVPGSSILDLDEEVIAEYIEHRQRRQPTGFVGSTETLLKQIGALAESGSVTVSGMLLFGKEPQSFLPQAGLTFVMFPGEDRHGSEGIIGYGRRVDVSGPLARMIERTWQVVWESMDKKSVVRGLQREEVTEYPMIAVREALVNAFAHRDYRIMGRRIEVMMFKDRLEVTSPGGLPGYITLNNIVDEHFSRNPRIVNGLLQWGYIEELGLGVDKMIETMVTAGHPSPEFRATPHSFSVILRKGHDVGEHVLMPEWESNMNERQMKALQWVQEHARITNRDYRHLCSNVSAETLRLDLVDLVEKGVLLKIGVKKGTYYVLKRRPE